MERYDTQKDKGSKKVKPEPPNYVPRPLWQPFPGFSCLFNNPGSSLRDDGHLQRLEVANLNAPEVELYNAFHLAINEIGSEKLASRYNLFTLPPSTYHVTVWDGLNQGNLETLATDISSAFDMYFNDAVTSAAESWPPLAKETNYENCFQDTRPVRFKFRSLLSRGTTVLVADLMPADEESKRNLAEIENLRAELDKSFEIYGKQPNAILRPHVAIGYYADDHLAYHAVTQNMDVWMQIFRSVAEGKTIEYSSIDLYAFTDMLTYFKCA